MAAPSYTVDLTLIHACDASSASWTEPTGFLVGSITLPETDFFIQNTGCLSKNQQTTGGNGAIFNTGGAQTVPTDGAFFAWIIFAAPNCLAAEASGGVQMFIGSGTGAFKQWYVRGSDTYTYGGWVCVPVNPTVSASATTGSPTTTLQYFGAGVSCPTAAPTKGNAFGLDICRYGRGEARFAAGDSGSGYCTFSGFAAQNDSLTNRWGLIQTVAGGYLWQGLITLGYGGVVDFRDSNTNLFIADTRKVTAAFNKIEVRNASSRVDWTGVSITCTSPTTTASKGRFECIDDADINFDYCTFTDMDTFIFKPTSTINNTIFRRCGLMTQGTAVYSSCTFDKPSGTYGILIDDISKISSTTFISKGTGYAIQGFSAAGNYTLTSLSFSGYAASDGSTGNEAIYVTATTGTVQLTISGGTTPSIRTAGATIVKVTSSRTIKAIVQLGDGTKVQSARVLVKTAETVASGFPYNTTVTIANSGTTATVTHSTHGMATNDKVQISGASLAANNGVFAIIKVDANSYTYTMGSSPGSSPTGTIKCSFVFLEGLTDSNGEISMSREIAATQLVLGWGRKSSGAPYYKQGSIAGSVSSSGNTTFTAILSPDS